jgi:hypothetical protein
MPTDGLGDMGELAFNWKFSADDLTALLRRISQREQSAAGQQATLSQAA